MTTAPDFMSVLSAGAHKSPEEGACVMEYVSLLAGEQFSDRPKCTNSTLTYTAQNTNDCLADDHRHLLIPLITRLIGANRLMTEPESNALNGAFVAAYMKARGPLRHPTGREIGLWKVEGLKAMLDKYDEITGRTQTEYPLTDEEKQQLLDAVATNHA